MQDLLLVAAVAAMFVFGWFLMKRLDCFLEKNSQSQELQLESGQTILRIGFSNPSIADSIRDVLEHYSKRCSSISIFLFYGTEQDLIKRLSANKLNVIFLPVDTDIPAGTHYNVREFLFNYTPIIMKYGGLPLEPISEGRIMQKVLWAEETETVFVSYFIKCLKDEFDVLKPQK